MEYSPWGQKVCFIIVSALADVQQMGGGGVVLLQITWSSLVCELLVQCLAHSRRFPDTFVGSVKGLVHTRGAQFVFKMGEQSLILSLLMTWL